MNQKCHFIGIGGIGMSGLARILLSKKVKVSGSDITTNYVTEDLINSGAKVFVGHSEEHISPDMTIIYSSDIKKDNPEFQAAVAKKCRMLHRADLLKELMQGYQALTVAGTHGKTTTTSLLITVLNEAKLDPTYAVGGIIPQLQSNAAHGSGHFFVAEADESDGTFLKYDSFGAIVTNIDNDHIDYYKSLDSLKEAFKEFISKVRNKDHLFWCADDPILANLEPKGIGYGFTPGSSLHLTNFKQEGWSIRFDLHFKGIDYNNVEVALTGKHNALNAAAVFGLALTLGIPEKTIRHALSHFKGVGRRCEKKGDVHGILILDDYAHHPTEIRATLKAVRNAIREKRLIAVFQPHRYTRTKECLDHYKDIFNDADEVIVTDIYAAGEQPIPGVTTEAVFNHVKAENTSSCRYVPRNQLVSALADLCRPHDVVIGLGAGDITKVGNELILQLKQKPPKKWKIGIIYGGRSCEHEISLMSAKNVLKMLESDYYEISHFGITKQGRWITGKNTFDKLEKGNESEESMINSEVFNELYRCEVLFPVLHGPYGEDGTIQGFFEMIGKPYVGCDHRSSAVSMDKALTKKLMLLNGIATVPYVDFSLGDWKTHSESILSQIKQQLIFPVFVKPVHLGSSIGVKKVDKFEDLAHVIQETFIHDDHILVENGLKMREIEFSLLGNDWVEAFPPGEILSSGKMYDYNSKYAADGFKTSYKADLPESLIEEGRELVRLAYKAAGCIGMARVDTFLDESNKFWLNEINPIPGFTGISLYPKMCEVNGLPGNELADRLIVLALQRFRVKNRMV